jgi:transposase
MGKIQQNCTLKERIVKLVLSGDESVNHAAKILGVHRSSIHNWINRYKETGKVQRFYGSNVGRPSSINEKNGRALLKILKQPASNFGYETDFWTRPRIIQVARAKLSLKLTKTAVLRFCKRFELSYKKPETRYYEANTKEQKAWQNTVVPKIKGIVRKHKAILYFEDESNISLTPVVGKSWSPKGQKVIQRITGKKGSVSAISAVSFSGHLIFNVHDAGKRFKSDDIISFLSQMLEYHSRRHLVVVMDQAPCHKSKTVKGFISKQKRLHVFYLPPRSPEFNPDEKIWDHLKNKELRDHKATTTSDLKRLTKKKLRKMSKNKKQLLGIYRRSEAANFFGK